MIETLLLSSPRREERSWNVGREALSQGLKSGRETRKGHPQFGRHLCGEGDGGEIGGGAREVV